MDRENEETQTLTTSSAGVQCSTGSGYRSAMYTRRARFKKNWRSRCLTSSPVLIILLLSFLQSYAFYGIAQSSIINNILQKSSQTTDTGLYGIIQQGLQYGLAWLAYPLGGLLADVYLGRRRTFRICLFLLWVTNVVITFSIAIGTNLFDSDVSLTSSALLRWIPTVCLALQSISEGVFAISLFVFGGDQLFDAPSAMVSSYIYWWYWTKNLGSLVGFVGDTAIVSLHPLDDSLKANFTPFLQPLFSAIVLTVAIVLDIFTSQCYEAEHKNKNPISLVCGVVYNSKQWRQQPHFMSAFRYGEDPPKGLELARQYHGGHYTDEQVQDVRSFGRMITFLLPLSFFMITYYLMRDMVSFQMDSCAQQRHLVANGSVQYLTPLQYIFNNFEPLLNSVLVVVMVPISNNFIFPVLGHYLPNMRKRMGVGCVLLLAAAVTLTLLELNISESPLTRFYWFILPIFLYTAAEVATVIAVLEFIYAQSPDNMKGLITGIFYLLFGVWSFIANIINYYINQLSELDNCSSELEQLLTKSPTFWYYCGCICVGTIGLLIYCLSAWCYQIRKRNNPVTDMMRITSYYPQ